MRSFGVRIGLAVAAVLLAGTVMAQGPGGGMGPGAGFGQHRPPMERSFGEQGAHVRWWNNLRIVEQLKLTDEQRKTFDGILLEHREKLIDLRASLQKAELALEPLMRDDPPNEAKVLAQIDKVAQARAELEKANARFLLDIRGKLTPEQWKTLQAIRANREREGKWSMGQNNHGPYVHRAHPLAPLPPPDGVPPAPPA